MKALFRVAMAAASLVVVRADAPPLTALARVEPGQWTLRAVDGHAASRTLCLGDTRVLLQLQHPNAMCSRFIIANDADSTIVHYTCPGAGHGRTEVKVETPRLMRIMSQGIADNAPFQWVVEARHTGTCGASSAR